MKIHLQKWLAKLVVILILIAAPLYAFAQVTLTSSTPAANAASVDASTNIALSFSSNLAANTVNTTNIVVRGQQSGAIGGH